MSEVEAQPGDFVVDGRAWRMGSAQTGPAEVSKAAAATSPAALAAARARMAETDPALIAAHQGIMFDYADELGGLVAGGETAAKNLFRLAVEATLPRSFHGSRFERPSGGSALA